ncbi:MAG TPA: hypothetical protein VNF47_18435 [Streptosporangiaceae bacterium]|nr:hypothetical protein [Streptosporangiaceae bacterium]
MRDARRYELRLISYDRPAYGGSTPMTGRVIADCAPDVEAVLREVRLFFQDRAAAREKFRSEAAEMYNRLSEPEGWLRMWGDRAGTDAAHGQDAANHLASVFQDGWTRGDEGWWDDWSAFLSPWGFDLDTITAPVSLWHGMADKQPQCYPGVVADQAQQVIAIQSGFGRVSGSDGADDFPHIRATGQGCAPSGGTGPENNPGMLGHPQGFVNQPVGGR